MKKKLLYLILGCLFLWPVLATSAPLGMLQESALKGSVIAVPMRTYERVLGTGAHVDSASFSLIQSDVDTSVVFDVTGLSSWSYGDTAWSQVALWGTWAATSGGGAGDDSLQYWVEFSGDSTHWSYGIPRGGGFVAGQDMGVVAVATRLTPRASPIGDLIRVPYLTRYMRFRWAPSGLSTAGALGTCKFYMFYKGTVVAL